jgi:hypothetical protein
MPNQIDQFVKLQEVIFLYMESAKKPETEFLRLWRMAFRGFTQMGLNAFWQPKTVSLPINANRTVTLPSDFIQWIKVGQITGGLVVTLKNNQALYTATQTFEGVADIIGSDVWFSGYVPVCRSEAAASAEFKVMNGYILLNSGFEGDAILLEYICSPQRDNDYEIPIQFQEAMIAWLAWQDKNYLPSTSHVGNGNIQMLQANFRAQVKLARKMYKPFRLSEVMGGLAEYTQSASSLLDKPIVPSTPIMFSAHWDWIEGRIEDPFTQPLRNVAEFPFGEPISLVLGAAPTRDSYLEIRYPATESVKLTYYNTALNYGTMGDQSFLPIKSNDTDRVIVSRVSRLQFDDIIPTIFA